MNIFDKTNAHILKAIKLCLNWDSSYMKLYGVDYKYNRELYKCRLLDEKFGGRVTVYLEEQFIRSAIAWINKGGKWWNN